MLSTQSKQKTTRTMKLLSFTLLLLYSFFLIGCSDPTIDATSPETLQKSLENTMLSLPEVQQEQFRQDVIVLARGESPDPNLSMRDYLEGRDNPVLAKPLILRNFYNSLHGKTGAGVISEAVQLRTIQEKKLEEEQAKQAQRAAKKEQLLTEINAIQKQQKQATINEIQLRSIKIWRANFSYVERPGDIEGDIVMQPTIQVTVYNGSDYTFHKIHLIASLIRPDDKRSIQEGGFMYTLAQGLAPGTQASWTIRPAAASGWDALEIPEGATLVVKITRVDDAQGQELLPGMVISAEDKAKLEQLRQRYRDQFGSF